MNGFKIGIILSVIPITVFLLYALTSIITSMSIKENFVTLGIIIYGAVIVYFLQRGIKGK